MKNKICLFIFLMLIVSCENTTDGFVLDSQLIGEWKAVAVQDDVITQEEENLGRSIWQPIENGEIVVFNNNGIYENLNSACVSGSYTTLSNELYINCIPEDYYDLPLPYRFFSDSLIINSYIYTTKYIRN